MIFENFKGHSIRWTWATCPDSVPGRMGLLITLYLIMINTYNSVDAPTNRGFSSIEIWFVGAQVPILMAVLEYGVLLAITKFWQPNNPVNLAKGINIYKAIDFFTFIASLMFIASFNIFYWLHWNGFKCDFINKNCMCAQNN